MSNLYALLGLLLATLPLFGQADIILLPVQGGTFHRGDEWVSGHQDELPVKSIVIHDFEITQTEITVAQYRQFCVATGQDLPAPPRWGWQDSSPIVKVSWEEAQRYANWLGTQLQKSCRLPTEAEWEYAAKGGQRRQSFPYSGSMSADSVAWTRSNADGRPSPVGRLRPNELGLYDMSGNVREWCMDWYASTYYKIAAQDNPQGPPRGKCKVTRGGSWLDAATDSRSTYRSCSRPRTTHPAIGFRVVCEPS